MEETAENQAIIDLTTCDWEPIHLIGAVQPHGCLIAFGEHDHRIAYASANTMDYLGVSHDAVLGSPAQNVLGHACLDALFDRPLDASEPQLLRPWFAEITPLAGASRKLELVAHRNNGHIVLECLSTKEHPGAIWQEEIARQRVISELVRPSALAELADVSARLIREITGFDRVMIYRFAEDRHGEVIAESTVRTDSFLGLHYPASDIPDPARRHFVRNVIRFIPSLNAAQAPVYGVSGVIADAHSDAPIDLTCALLRAVAPVHVEYLNNMGVEASLSISLITNDELWGLVACHNYAPRFLSSSRLRFAELIGTTISTLLQSIENTAQLRQSIDAERTAHAIERTVRTGATLADAVRNNASTLMEAVDASGMLFSRDGDTRKFGFAPADLPSIAPLRAQAIDGIAASSNLPSVLSIGANQTRSAAGAALMELSDDGSDYLIFLREEFEQTIRWAGRPDKIGERLDDGTLRLSPRGSFALWREERRGTSRPFDAAAREVLRILRRALFALNSLERERAAVKAQREAEAEEARLRHTLLEASRTSSLGELASALAHELNQPLTAVANYTNACRKELRNAGVEIPDEVGTLFDLAISESLRAGDLVRRMRDFIKDGRLIRSRIDLNKTIRDSVNLALSTGRPADLDLRFAFCSALPPVFADPVQIGQVILNLARNSLSALKSQDRKQLIVVTSTSQTTVTVSIRDTGGGIPPQLLPRLFEPFHESTTSGMGLGLSICRTVVEAHGGRIWAEQKKEGAELSFTLPLNEAPGSDEI